MPGCSDSGLGGISKRFPVLKDKQIFGAYLGESMSNVLSRAKAKGISAKQHYLFKNQFTLSKPLNGSSIVKEMQFSSYRDRVYEISLSFNRNSKEQYSELSAELHQTYTSSASTLDQNLDGYFPQPPRVYVFTKVNRQRVIVCLERNMKPVLVYPQDRVKPSPDGTMPPGIHFHDHYLNQFREEWSTSLRYEYEEFYRYAQQQEELEEKAANQLP